MEELKGQSIQTQYNNSIENKEKEYGTFFKDKKLIGKHEIKEIIIKKKEIAIQTTAEFIIQIEYFYISGGTNNQLIIYDSNKNYIGDLKYNDWTYNILEFKRNEDKIIIIASSKLEIYLFYIDTLNLKIDFYQERYLFKKYSSNYLINIRDTNTNDNESYNYWSCCEDKVTHFGNLYNKIIQLEEKYTVLDYKIKSGIQINKKIIVFKSNKIISKGKDKLLFF